MIVATPARIVSTFSRLSLGAVIATKSRPASASSQNERSKVTRQAARLSASAQMSSARQNQELMPPSTSTAKQRMIATGYANSPPCS